MFTLRYRGLDVFITSQRGLRIEVNWVAVVFPKFVEVCGIREAAVRFRKFGELAFIAANEDGFGHQRDAARPCDTALRAYREYRSHQVLVRAHASGDAVHDDADALGGQSAVPFVFSEWELWDEWDVWDKWEANNQSRKVAPRSPERGACSETRPLILVPRLCLEPQLFAKCNWESARLATAIAPSLP